MLEGREPWGTTLPVFLEEGVAACWRAGPFQANLGLDTPVYGTNLNRTKLGKVR